MNWGQTGGTFSSTKWLEAVCFGEHFVLPFLAVAMTRVWESLDRLYPTPVQISEVGYIGKRFKNLAANGSNVLWQKVPISCGKRFKYLVANGSNFWTKSRKVIPPHQYRAQKHGIWSPGAERVQRQTGQNEVANGIPNRCCVDWQTTDQRSGKWFTWWQTVT